MAIALVLLVSQKDGRYVDKAPFLANGVSPNFVEVLNVRFEHLEQWADALR
jgi:hypothetical protein